MDKLKHLWHTVFGDDQYIIDTYFEIFYDPQLTAVEYQDRNLAAAAYVMPAGYLVDGDSRQKCAHIYAVAVYPQYRGLGLGISVTNKAVMLAKKAGYSAVVLHPASDSLFGYYEKHCSFSTCFSARSHTRKISAPVNMPQADIHTYRQHRENFLKNTPHIELNTEILTFFVKCGGKLYAYENGCAAVEDFDNISHVRELLGDFGDGINAFETCLISTLGIDTPSGMIHGQNTFQHGWLGLTLE